MIRAVQEADWPPWRNRIGTSLFPKPEGGQKWGRRVRAASPPGPLSIGWRGGMKKDCGTRTASPPSPLSIGWRGGTKTVSGTRTASARGTRSTGWRGGRWLEIKLFNVVLGENKRFSEQDIIAFDFKLNDTTGF